MTRPLPAIDNIRHDGQQEEFFEEKFTQFPTRPHLVAEAFFCRELEPMIASRISRPQLATLSLGLGLALGACGGNPTSSASTGRQDISVAAVEATLENPLIKCQSENLTCLQSGDPFSCAATFQTCLTSATGQGVSAASALDDCRNQAGECAANAAGSGDVAAVAACRTAYTDCVGGLVNGGAPGADDADGGVAGPSAPAPGANGGGFSPTGFPNLLGQGGGTLPTLPGLGGQFTLPTPGAGGAPAGGLSGLGGTFSFPTLPQLGGGGGSTCLTDGQTCASGAAQDPVKLNECATKTRECLRGQFGATGGGLPSPGAAPATP